MLTEQMNVIFCHYWYFKDTGFKYEPYLCNGCHDLKQKANIFNYVSIVSIKENIKKHKKHK